MILHVDMDAFFASVEQAINPRLKGKPLIVGTRPNKLHTAVCAASYEAKALGIGSGMTSAEAFALCPYAEFVAADQGKYIWTSEQILGMLEAYDFPTNYASIDEFQLDISSHPEPFKLAQEIQERIHDKFDITASIGIAKNWMLAKLGSKLKKPNGITIITDANLEETLAKTPVSKLCGVGAKTEAVLLAENIKTCLDLYQQTPGFLNEKLGKYGLEFYAGLRGEDHLEKDGREEPPKSVGHSYTLPGASQNAGFIHGWLRMLSEMVAARLRRKSLVSATVHLWLNGPELGHFGAQKTYQNHTNDGQEIFSRALKIMAKTGPRMPRIRALGVTCGGLQKAVYAPLFPEDKRREELLKTVDKINNKYGEHSVCPAIVKLSEKFKR